MYDIDLQDISVLFGIIGTAFFIAGRYYKGRIHKNLLLVGKILLSLFFVVLVAGSLLEFFT